MVIDVWHHRPEDDEAQVRQVGHHEHHRHRHRHHRQLVRSHGLPKLRGDLRGHAPRGLPPGAFGTLRRRDGGAAGVVVRRRDEKRGEREVGDGVRGHVLPVPSGFHPHRQVEADENDGVGDEGGPEDQFVQQRVEAPLVLVLHGAVAAAKPSHGGVHGSIPVDAERRARHHYRHRRGHRHPGSGVDQFQLTV